jgi:hypothetical protein
VQIWLKCSLVSGRGGRSACLPGHGSVMICHGRPIGELAPLPLAVVDGFAHFGSVAAAERRPSEGSEVLAIGPPASQRSRSALLADPVGEFLQRLSLPQPALPLLPLLFRLLLLHHLPCCGHHRRRPSRQQIPNAPQRAQVLLLLFPRLLPPFPLCPLPTSLAHAGTLCPQLSPPISHRETTSTQQHPNQQPRQSISSKHSKNPQTEKTYGYTAPTPLHMTIHIQESQPKQ